MTTTFIGSAYPYIFGRLVDEVFYGQHMTVFIQIVLIYGGLFLVGQLLHFTLNITWAHLMTRFLFTVRKALFDKTLSLKAKFLHDMQTGDIMKRMRDDTEEFMNFIHWNVLYLSAGVISLLIALGMIFYFNIYIGLVTIAVTPVMTTVTRRFGDKAKDIHKKLKRDDGVLQSWCYEILKGMR
ncbi:MAG: ABC transporter ATP-binding protein, partial [Oscillospiraceae bacterium]|nr:ABC transporter ATP-binding protein [Oscillospiraceae bacterium]